MLEQKMNINDRCLKIDEITELIINSAYNVANTLGYGFLEKVYENSLAHELSLSHLNAKQQYNLEVKYKDKLVGNYIADLLVNDSVLVEVKSVKAFEKIHYAQCLNYLKATDLKVCLLINFGKPKIEIKRIVNNL
jgi:GxxExxY protein